MEVVLPPAGGSANVVKEDRLGEYTYPVYKLPKNTTLIYRNKVQNPDEPNSGVLTQFQVQPQLGFLDCLDLPIMWSNRDNRFDVLSLPVELFNRYFINPDRSYRVEWTLRGKT